MNRIRVGVIMFSYDVVESAVNDLYGDVAVLLQIRAHPQTHMGEVSVGSNEEIDEGEIEKRVIIRIKEEESSEIEEFLGKLFTIEVKKVRPEDMARNERTGKIKR
jgi:hypothetical protein